MLSEQLELYAGHYKPWPLSQKEIEQHLQRLLDHNMYRISISYKVVSHASHADASVTIDGRSFKCADDQLEVIKIIQDFICHLKTLPQAKAEGQRKIIDRMPLNTQQQWPSPYQNKLVMDITLKNDIYEHYKNAICVELVEEVEVKTLLSHYTLPKSKTRKDAA